MTGFSTHQIAQVERLRALHVRHGWRFEAHYDPDPPHDLEELVYSRPDGPWLTVLRVRSSTDARVCRVLIASLGDRVPVVPWSARGTLCEVLDELGEA
jgi:hypothetical protein